VNETGDAAALRPAALGFALVIGLHNAEEWLTFPLHPESWTAAQRHFGLALAPPDWAQFELALGLATVLPWALLAWIGSGRANAARAFVLTGMTSAILANVMVPHIPLTLLERGYTPGIASAVLINLPFCLWVLARTRHGGTLGANGWRIAVLGGLLCLPLVLLAVMAISGGLAGAA